MTDRYAPLGEAPTGPAVTLVAQADFHLFELDRVAAELDARGIASRVVVPVIRWKPLHSIRPTVRRVRQLVANSGRTLGDPIAVDDLLTRSRAVLVMNDWGVPRLLVERARASGCPTFALVEGVQDYDDIDTGLQRRAYRRVEHVFTLGAAGAGILGPERCTVVGSERIQQLAASAPEPAGTSVVINSNFTYGVLAEERAGWVRGVVEASEAAGRPWLLSRHPAERGRSAHRIVRRPVDDLVAEAGTLVTRFSTVAFDALALGVELVYHNPHGERVPTFQTEVEGFSVTRSTDELRRQLEAAPRPRAEVRAASSTFLRRHVLLDDGSTPAARVADEMAARLG